MTRRVVLVAVALVAAATASAAALARGQSPRFEVVAHTGGGVAYTADVWGHAGHAYLSSHRGARSCDATGVRVFDVRDRAHPQLVARFADARSVPGLVQTWTEKTIARSIRTASFTGDLAATSIQSCRNGAFQGFVLYDVSRPAAPRRLAAVRTSPRGSHELWLGQHAGRAYVHTAIVTSELSSATDGKPGEPDFRIYDVSNPERPVRVGGWGAWRALGIRPDAHGDGPLDVNLVHSVITNAVGTRAFLSYWDLGTVILDISNPRRPRYLGRTGPTENAHSAALSANERLLVETHETEGGTATLFDVSTPRRPRRLGTVALSERQIAEGRREKLLPGRARGLADSVHDPKLVGSTAFFSWYQQGVVAADVSDPRRPRVLARFLPPPEDDPERLFCPDSSCTAFWGVYPLGDVVLASDMIGGLWVLRLVR